MVLQASRSGRHPVKVEIAGSSPVRTALDHARGWPQESSRADARRTGESGSRPAPALLARVAQLAEHFPDMEEVAGSNPAADTLLWCNGEHVSLRSWRWRFDSSREHVPISSSVARASGPHPEDRRFESCLIDWCLNPKGAGPDCDSGSTGFDSRLAPHP